jgi:hypothetical protein
MSGPPEYDYSDMEGAAEAQAVKRFIKQMVVRELDVLIANAKGGSYRPHVSVRVIKNRVAELQADCMEDK